VDSNGDGRISLEELVTALKKQGVDDEKVLARSESLIKALDVNQDGSVSYHELLLATVERRLLAKEDRIWQAFSKFDKMRDGKLTPKEIADVLKIPIEEAKELVREADLDGDGVVTYEEFNALMMAKEEESFQGIASKLQANKSQQGTKPAQQTTKIQVTPASPSKQQATQQQQIKVQG